MIDEKVYNFLGTQLPFRDNFVQLTLTEGQTCGIPHIYINTSAKRVVKYTLLWGLMEISRKNACLARSNVRLIIFSK